VSSKIEFSTPLTVDRNINCFCFKINEIDSKLDSFLINYKSDIKTLVTKLNTLTLSNSKSMSEITSDQPSQTMKISVSDTQCLKLNTSTPKESVKIKSILIKNSIYNRTFDRSKSSCSATSQTSHSHLATSKRIKLKNCRSGIKKQLKFEQDLINRIDGTSSAKLEISREKLSLSMQNIKSMSKAKVKNSKSESDLICLFQMKRPAISSCIRNEDTCKRKPDTFNETNTFFSIESSDDCPL
jgi:hypothetical protein